MSHSIMPAIGGRIEHYADFASAHVLSRHVDVWLPAGYNDDPQRRYPVLYAHDGQNLFHGETAYGGVPWGVDEVMTRLIDTGKIQPAIVVGVWNTPQRMREYMPQRAFTLPQGQPRLSRFVELTGGVPLSDAYLHCLTQELKPLVDANYRTQPDAGHTFIMGSSMGGLISMYAVCEYPSVFSAAACLSIHWPPLQGIAVDYLAARLPAPGSSRFYFDHGDIGEDAAYGPYQQRANAIMRDAGYTPGRDWLTQVFPGTDHSESAWHTRLHIPLTFLLGV